MKIFTIVFYESQVGYLRKAFIREKSDNDFLWLFYHIFKTMNTALNSTKAD